ncbi:coat protein [ssRNA phage Esthiorhiza.3_6]|uniref:Coat protein n=2 Tax=Leviviricetes TaxID=2842243 RepID=A0A8S5L133_9VIRU|nr:coat protein [ssRNA phage Esthiorhiza.3_6]QDH86877.1 MAG: hypothetical protein H3RhizoLitter14466_000002 [Leviviridae sp.]DAD51345.1 TPA_asm: coat protein [ssRNA phage Esthiorhiza.3_6]
MLNDPITINISAVDIVMPRTRTEPTKSVYRSADGLHRLVVSYSENKGSTRYLLRYEEDAVAADPISAANKQVSSALYLVIDQPTFGIEDARVAAQWAGFKSLVDATLLGKVLGNQT